MKILAFTPDLDGGGAQRTMINLVQGFREAGQDASLVAGRTDGPAHAWLPPALPVHDLQCRRIRGTLLPLIHLLRAECPDVLLSTMIDANIVALAASRFTPHPRPVTVLRETNSHTARGDIGRLRRRLIRSAYGAADGVVALSSGVREELIDLYGLAPEGIVTIHNPVAVEAIAKKADFARGQESPFPAGGHVLVAVGRLTRQKGHDLLLRAVAALPRQDVRVAILGEGEDRAALTYLAETLGLGARLLMPGFVREPEAWLAHADAFVLASRWEGFGHVVVEAMAAGQPVIAFDCPHGPRDIITSGVNGLLVPDGDLPALTQALEDVLDDAAKARRLAAAGHRDAERFTLARITETYLEFFSGLLSARR